MAKKILRKWIELVYSTAQSLRAEDIPYDASSSIKEKIDEHEAATSGIHGVGTGSLVTTTGTQTLSNKTLTDPIVDQTITTPNLSNKDLQLYPDGFGRVIAKDLGFKNDDSDDYALILQIGGTITDDKSLSINVDNGNRILTIEDDAIIDQDLTQDASPTFESINLVDNLVTGFALQLDVLSDITIPLTADRTLYLDVDDGDRILTISRNITLDQDISSTSSPTFESINIIDDYITGFVLKIDSLSDSLAQLTTDRTLYLDVDNGDRILTIEGNTKIDQDLTQDAEGVQFGSIGNTRIHIPILSKTDDYIITTNDLDKSIRMLSGANKTFTLPDGVAAIDGYRVTLIKNGAGHLAIQAADMDDIGSSGAGTASGGLVENNTTETYACITLEWVNSVSTWVPISTYGTWTFVAV